MPVVSFVVFSTLDCNFGLNVVRLRSNYASVRLARSGLSDPSVWHNEQEKPMNRNAETANVEGGSKWWRGFRSMMMAYYCYHLTIVIGTIAIRLFAAVDSL